MFARRGRRIRHGALHVRHARGAAHHHHAIDVVRIDVGVAQAS
jgi:hypothetical protein